MKREIGHIQEVGGGGLVIDYVLLEEKKREGIRRMEITENIDLDHHLLIIWLKEKRERADRRAGRTRYWPKKGGERLKESIEAMERRKEG